MCWLWRERRRRAPAPPTPRRSCRRSSTAALAALDLARYADDKRAFFADDVTARYLSERIAAAAPPDDGRVPRGSFGWVAQELPLAPVERFVLALALLPGGRQRGRRGDRQLPQRSAAHRADAGAGAAAVGRPG